MHRGAGVGLGDHQQMRRPRQLERLLAQRGELPLGRSPQDPEPRVLAHPGPRFPILAGKVVFPVAEESEVTVGEPVEELLGFLHFGAIDGSRPRVQPFHDFAKPIAHRAPVLDRCSYFTKHPFDACPQLVAPLFVGLTGHLRAKNRFGDAVLG